MNYLSKKQYDRENHRKWREANPAKARANGRRAARKLKNLPNPTRPEPQMCECCGKAFQSGAYKGPHLDHDHHTNKFRGWICSNCNKGLGLLGDSEDSLMKALDYIRRNS